MPWWSVYEIGQRLCERFDDVESEETATRLPRIFIAGNACHTHTPKAGQGMNVSMQDAFNLGWKLAAVLQGRSPASVLLTYSTECQAVAQELIDFDREWAAMLSDRSRSDAAAAQKYFVQHGRYTAGTATLYKPAVLTGAATHQVLATGLLIGIRFHSAPVIRIGDGKQLQLGGSFLADGKWRLIAFAGRNDAGASGSPIATLCHFLTASPESTVMRFTAPGAGIDAVIDVRAVFLQSHYLLVMTALAELLFPAKGCHGLRDYEKAFRAIAENNDMEN